MSIHDQTGPLPSFDARDWAAAFMEKFSHRKNEIDESVMLGWFANALMRGYDERQKRNLSEMQKALGSAFVALQNKNQDDALTKAALEDVKAALGLEPRPF